MWHCHWSARARQRYLEQQPTCSRASREGLGPPHPPAPRDVQGIDRPTADEGGESAEAHGAATQVRQVHDAEVRRCSQRGAQPRRLRSVQT